MKAKLAKANRNRNYFNDHTNMSIQESGTGLSICVHIYIYNDIYILYIYTQLIALQYHMHTSSKLCRPALSQSQYLSPFTSDLGKS